MAVDSTGLQGPSQYGTYGTSSDADSALKPDDDMIHQACDQLLKDSFGIQLQDLAFSDAIAAAYESVRYCLDELSHIVANNSRSHVQYSSARGPGGGAGSSNILIRPAAGRGQGGRGNGNGSDAQKRPDSQTPGQGYGAATRYAAIRPGSDLRSSTTPRVTGLTNGESGATGGLKASPTVLSSTARPLTTPLHTTKHKGSGTSQAEIAPPSSKTIRAPTSKVTGNPGSKTSLGPSNKILMGHGLLASTPGGHETKGTPPPNGDVSRQRPTAMWFRS